MLACRHTLHEVHGLGGCTTTHLLRRRVQGHAACYGCCVCCVCCRLQPVDMPHKGYIQRRHQAICCCPTSATTLGGQQRQPQGLITPEGLHQLIPLAQPAWWQQQEEEEAKEEEEEER